MLTIFAAFRCVFRPQQGYQGCFFLHIMEIYHKTSFSSSLQFSGLQHRGSVLSTLYGNLSENKLFIIISLLRVSTQGCSCSILREWGTALSTTSSQPRSYLPGWFSFCATHILVGFGQIDCWYTGGGEGAGGKVETWRNSWRSGLVNTTTKVLHCLVYNCLHIWLTLYNCLHIWSTFYNWTYIWQDWLTLLSFEKPELINILPCEFNRWATVF